MVSVFVVGIMMVIAGIAEIVNAFQIKTWGRFLLWLLLGALYVVAGFLTLKIHISLPAILTLFLGVALIVSGVMRIILAFSMQAAMPWVLVLVSGVITLLLGLVIVAHWPVASLYVLGIFLGVDLILAGAGWLAIGLGLKRVVSRVAGS